MITPTGDDRISLLSPQMSLLVWTAAGFPDAELRCMENRSMYGEDTQESWSGCVT